LSSLKNKICYHISRYEDGSYFPSGGAGSINENGDKDESEGDWTSINGENLANNLDEQNVNNEDVQIENDPSYQQEEIENKNSAPNLPPKNSDPFIPQDLQAETQKVYLSNSFYKIVFEANNFSISYCVIHTKQIN